MPALPPSGAGRRAGHRSGRRARRAPMAEINVTPFVDVMLVLLVIFMVSAPLLTVGVPMALPKTAARAVTAEPEAPLTISLAEDGAVYLMDTPVARDDLLPRLQEIAAERQTGKIYLRADGRISYEQVIQVMGALNAGGFNNIVLVTEAGGPRFGGQN